MQSFGFVWFCFIISFIAHALLHRYLASRRGKFLWSAAVYIVGAAMLFLLWQLQRIVYPLSAEFLYILMTVTTVFFYLSLFVEGETPSSMILTSFQKKHRQTFVQLVHLYTSYGLIGKRIDSLKEHGLVVYRRGKFSLTSKGRMVFTVIETYKKLFHRMSIE